MPASSMQAWRRCLSSSEGWGACFESIVFKEPGARVWAWKASVTMSSQSSLFSRACQLGLGQGRGCIRRLNKFAKGMFYQQTHPQDTLFPLPWPLTGALGILLGFKIYCESGQFPDSEGPQRGVGHEPWGLGQPGGPRYLARKGEVGSHLKTAMVWGKQRRKG